RLAEGLDLVAAGVAGVDLAGGVVDGDAVLDREGGVGELAVAERSERGARRVVVANLEARPKAGSDEDVAAVGVDRDRGDVALDREARIEVTRGVVLADSPVCDARRTVGVVDHVDVAVAI